MVKGDDGLEHSKAATNYRPQQGGDRKWPDRPGSLKITRCKDECFRHTVTPTAPEAPREEKEVQLPSEGSCGLMGLTREVNDLRIGKRGGREIFTAPITSRGKNKGSPGQAGRPGMLGSCFLLRRGRKGRRHGGNCMIREPRCHCTIEGGERGGGAEHLQSRLDLHSRQLEERGEGEPSNEQCGWVSTPIFRGER